MESNTEPSDENEWTEFEFTDNNYNVSCNKGIGSYFLWVKILYKDELEQNKRDQRRAISAPYSRCERKDTAYRDA